MFSEHPAVRSGCSSLECSGSKAKIHTCVTERVWCVGFLVSGPAREDDEMGHDTNTQRVYIAAPDLSSQTDPGVSGTTPVTAAQSRRHGQPPCRLSVAAQKAVVIDSKPDQCPYTYMPACCIPGGYYRGHEATRRAGQRLSTSHLQRRRHWERESRRGWSNARVRGRAPGPRAVSVQRGGVGRPQGKQALPLSLRLD